MGKIIFITASLALIMGAGTASAMSVTVVSTNQTSGIAARQSYSPGKPFSITAFQNFNPVAAPSTTLTLSLFVTIKNGVLAIRTGRSSVAGQPRQGNAPQTKYCTKSFPVRVGLNATVCGYTITVR